MARWSHKPQLRVPRTSRLVASAATADPESDEGAALLRWCEESGGFVGAIAIEEREGMRGLFVTQDVAAGERLLSVPRACTLSAAEAPECGLSLAQLCACGLLGAKARGEQGAYMASLPTEEPLLCDWSDSELSALCSPMLSADAAAQRAYVAESLEQIRPWVAPTVTADEIAWAERMVRSRALAFDFGWDGRPTLSLVPIIDLANHATPMPTAVGDSSWAVEPVQLDEVEEAVHLVAPTDLRAGSEVCICYRFEGGNGALLLNYGFAVAPRANDTWSHERLQIGTAAAAAVAAGVVAKAGLDEQVQDGGGGCDLVIGSDDDDAYAVRMLQLWLRRALQANEGTAAGEVNNNITAATLDRATCEALLAACEGELERLACAEEALELALSLEATGGAGVAAVAEISPSRLVAATSFRLAQRGQLTRTVSALRRALAEKEAPGGVNRRAILRALRQARVTHAPRAALLVV